MSVRTFTAIDYEDVRRRLTERLYENMQEQHKYSSVRHTEKMRHFTLAAKVDAYRDVLNLLGFDGNQIYDDAYESILRNEELRETEPPQLRIEDTSGSRV